MQNLIRQLAADMVASRYAIVLTGAGVSTESGVPDFRGPKGIWTTNPQAEAQAYQRYERFLNDPKAYWEEMLGTVGTSSNFYQEMRKVEPNPGHYAIARLEHLGIVKQTITQNIDGLHEKAGTRNVMHYHGTVEKLRCLSCGSRFSVDDYSLEKLPPLCRCGRPLKYDVVHFKEPIPSDIMDAAESEAMKCDLMLICGTSAVVYPFAALPAIARNRGRSGVRIIEVNAEPTPLTHQGISDYLIQGKTGEVLPLVVDEVGRLMGWGRPNTQACTGLSPCPQFSESHRPDTAAEKRSSTLAANHPKAPGFGVSASPSSCLIGARASVRFRCPSGG
ncbi:MAG: NAD-dependent deacylase [Dehalococcoidia bacterium]|nr:NAD-dependent deacylase [Dehalococcoidia bacterium]